MGALLAVGATNVAQISQHSDIPLAPGLSHMGFLSVMAGLVTAIHIVLQGSSQQLLSEVGGDLATPCCAADTWMAGTSPGHDGEGRRAPRHMRSPCPSPPE